jgi:hypothetical protein
VIIGCAQERNQTHTQLRLACAKCTTANWQSLLANFLPWDSNSSKGQKPSTRSCPLT